MDLNDFLGAIDWMSDDFECVWPQSGEVIQGGWNYAMINIHYPSYAPWRFVIEDILVQGQQVVSNIHISDGIQQARLIAFSTVNARKIVRQIEYWPESFTAPQWRRQWISCNEKNEQEILPPIERRQCFGMN
jgi:hypothetical protein